MTEGAERVGGKKEERAGVEGRAPQVVLSRIGKDAPGHPCLSVLGGRGGRDAHINGAPFPPLSWPDSERMSSTPAANNC